MLLCLFSEVFFSWFLVVLDKAELVVEICGISRDLRQKMIVTHPKLGCS